MQLNAKQVRDALPWDRLIEALNEIFTKQVSAPVRHHHSINVPNEPQATLLLMPAWLEGEYLGVKLVNVFPGNSARGLPGLNSHYILSSAKTGEPLARLDANELTARRTAAASAMASAYLSREDSTELLMVGAGRMSRYLIPAHLSVRPIASVRVWNRNEATAANLVAELKADGIQARVCPAEQLEAAAKTADIISCATLSTTPLIKGEWLKPGAHLDLVGSFTPTMRETDNIAMQRCSVFVDVRAGALSETGDLIIPIREGAISEEIIKAEFAELCSGQHKGRAELDDPQNAITLFKSVGDSREDLAAAVLAYQQTEQYQN
ncbi:ornithine cyclodeaminase family protein [Amphritea pacifica]|uniref:Ornithine cyclodeaminase family protein n=1 Tax=Amphritea pacifica TaxID=2811233 RepID=A0ABS2W799_9GAMM|nr:ornithine cyclodeaminase family protein [Amphritea pacifica]MBN0987277.1 ornithine cyclodeaminase family protein [Amphritea pacifica]MBN1005767.1 ornithine cyclodeaminase family protein [Amphritea pacifica]